MIDFVLDAFYPKLFDFSISLPKAKVSQADNVLKLSYMATKDKEDEFQIELLKEGDKYILSMSSTDDKLTLYPTEYTSEEKAMNRFEILMEGVKSKYEIVQESEKSEFSNDLIFTHGGSINTLKPYDDEKYPSEGAYLKGLVTNIFGKENRYTSSADWGGMPVWTVKGDKFFGVFILIDDNNNLVLMTRKSGHNDEDYEIDEDLMTAKYDNIKDIKALLNKAINMNSNKFAKGGMIAKRKKIEKVMKEFARGALKTAQGKIVENKDQAIAIALSESGVSKKEMGGFIESFRIPNYNLPLDYFALKNGDMNTTTSDWQLQNPT